MSISDELKLDILYQIDMAKMLPDKRWEYFTYLGYRLERLESLSIIFNDDPSVKLQKRNLKISQLGKYIREKICKDKDVGYIKKAISKTLDRYNDVSESDIFSQLCFYIQNNIEKSNNDYHTIVIMKRKIDMVESIFKIFLPKHKEFYRKFTRTTRTTRIFMDDCDQSTDLKSSLKIGNNLLKTTHSYLTKFQKHEVFDFLVTTQNQSEALRKIKKVIALTEKDILFLDPYINLQIIYDLFTELKKKKKKIKILILTNKLRDVTIPAIISFVKDSNLEIIIKKNNTKIHDRHICVDNKHLINCGGSFKDIGSKQHRLSNFFSHEYKSEWVNQFKQFWKSSIDFV